MPEPCPTCGELLEAGTLRGYPRCSACGWEPACEHGRAWDVHCCNCHSGFLFDAESCVCEVGGDPDDESDEDDYERWCLLEDEADRE